MSVPMTAAIIEPRVIKASKNPRRICSPRRGVNETAAPEANPAAMACGVVFMRERRKARYFQARMKPFFGQMKALMRSSKPGALRLSNMVVAPFAVSRFGVGDAA